METDDKVKRVNTLVPEESELRLHPVEIDEGLGGPRWVFMSSAFDSLRRGGASVAPACTRV